MTVSCSNCENANSFASNSINQLDPVVGYTRTQSIGSEYKIKDYKSGHS